MLRSVLLKAGAAAGAAALLAGCGAASAGSHSPIQSNTVSVAITGGTPNFWFPMNSAPDFTELNGEMNHLMYLPLVNVSHSNSVSFQ